jgi:hypothetical protein
MNFLKLIFNIFIVFFLLFLASWKQRPVRQANHRKKISRFKHLLLDVHVSIGQDHIYFLEKKILSIAIFVLFRF